MTDMRDRVADIWKPLADDADYYHGYPDIYRKTDATLALITDKWEVVEECSCLCHQVDYEGRDRCKECACHGTGTITRQSTWEEVEELLEFILNPQIDDWMVDRRQYEMRDGFWYYILKSGGRLRRKEAEE